MTYVVEAIGQDILDLIDSFNLVQHVSFPTQKHSHILDLVLSNRFTDLQLCDAVFSDHMTVIVDVPLHSSMVKSCCRVIVLWILLLVGMLAAGNRLTCMTQIQVRSLFST